MSSAVRNIFSLIFVSKKQKLKPSQGCEGASPRKLRRLRWFLREIMQNFIFSSYPKARSRGVRLNSGFFILSFCRSVKESIKESAFERRQELPAGTVAAPLCQPLKCGTGYRDVTAALKMKRLRRLWGERRSFLAVAMVFRRKLRREEGDCSRIV